MITVKPLDWPFAKTPVRQLPADLTYEQRMTIIAARTKANLKLISK